MTPSNRGAWRDAYSHLTTVLGNKVSEAEVVSVIETLGQLGRLTVDDKGAVTYQL